MRFLGFDHIDVRVRSLPAVEPFYDRLLPELALPRKGHAHVDAAGAWHEAGDERAANAAEYYEAAASTDPPRFIGFIEDPAMTPTATRIAFRVGARDELEGWETKLREFGARNVERSEDMDGYPALFFEDPAGTKLELCARRPADAP
jgi:hypothetical protein